MALQSNVLPTGTETVGVAQVDKCVHDIKACFSRGERAVWQLTELARLLDMNSNPQAYRACQDAALQSEADALLVSSLGTASVEHCKLWEALAVLAFNHEGIQRRIASSDQFYHCMRQTLSGSACILDRFGAMCCLASLAPCHAAHARLVPLLPLIAGIAADSRNGATQLLAVEVLVNVSYNSNLRPHVANAFSSRSLKQLVAQVRASERREDQFALAMLLANLGSHPTQDGRGCLGSALDWVPFKDFNIFDDLAAALKASTESVDWPPGSNAFHSTHRLASLVSALALAPLMQTLYASELSGLLPIMLRVVKAEGEAAGPACAALEALAGSPRNFGIIDGEGLEGHLVHLRDIEGLESAASLLEYLEKYRDTIVIAGGGILWRSTELLARAAHEAGGVEWRLAAGEHEVDRAHVQKSVKELSEEVDVSNHKCWELLGCLSKMQESKVSIAMSLWADAGFRSVDDAEERLSTLVNYCEEQCYAVGHKGTAPVITRDKLRMVAQLLHSQDDDSKLPVLIMLAAHGGVCNVQKEVGVDAAYSQLTRTAAEHAERCSFETCLLRVLRDKREQVMDQLCVECCAQKFQGTRFVNTHFLAPFRNKLAEIVGIREMPDPNGMLIDITEEEMSEYLIRFWQLYSHDEIIAEVDRALNDMPRRIPYHVTISWLEENTPHGMDVYHFLSSSFDLHGRVCRAAISQVLCRLGIFCSPTDILQVGPEALTVQQGAQAWHGLDAYLKLAEVWGISMDSERCHEAMKFYDSDCRGDLLQLIKGAEDNIEAGRPASAQDLLIAGAVINKELLPPSQGEVPTLATLLREAYRHVAK